MIYGEFEFAKTKSLVTHGPETADPPWAFDELEASPDPENLVKKGELKEPMFTPVPFEANFSYVPPLSVQFSRSSGPPFALDYPVNVPSPTVHLRKQLLYDSRPPSSFKRPHSAQPPFALDYTVRPYTSSTTRMSVEEDICDECLDEIISAHDSPLDNSSSVPQIIRENTQPVGNIEILSDGDKEIEEQKLTEQEPYNYEHSEGNIEDLTLNEQEFEEIEEPELHEQDDAKHEKSEPEHQNLPRFQDQFHNTSHGLSGTHRQSELTHS